MKHVQNMRYCLDNKREENAEEEIKERRVFE